MRVWVGSIFVPAPNPVAVPPARCCSAARAEPALLSVSRPVGALAGPRCAHEGAQSSRTAGGRPEPKKRTAGWQSRLNQWQCRIWISTCCRWVRSRPWRSQDCPLAKRQDSPVDPGRTWQCASRELNDSCLMSVTMRSYRSARSFAGPTAVCGSSWHCLARPPRLAMKS